MVWSASMAPLLQRLAAAADPDQAGSSEPTVLDRRTLALVRIGAAACDGAPESAYVSLVAAAREARASDEEILGAFLCVAAIAGESRFVTATPRISNAMGYDVDNAFEHG